VIAASPSGYWIARTAGRWDDILGDVSQGTAVAALTYEVYRATTFFMYFFRSGQDDALSMRFQLPHTIDKTGLLVPHLHVIPMSAPGAPQNVRIIGSYAWARYGEVVPDAGGWTTFGPLSVPFAAADQFKQTYLNLVDIIPPVGLRGSDILFVNVIRNGTNPADTYNTAKVGGTGLANLALASLDVHYRKSTQGSVTVVPT
jgi:hypothetical protein